MPPLAEDCVTVSGPSTNVPVRNAVTILLGIHELCTNAFKYGSLSVEGGRVAITWGNTTIGGASVFVFEWRESGGPAIAAPTHKGFGTTLLERGLAGELGGKIEIDYQTHGLVCRFIVPLAARQSGP